MEDNQPQPPVEKRRLPLKWALVVIIPNVVLFAWLMAGLVNEFGGRRDDDARPPVVTQRPKAVATPTGGVRLLRRSEAWSYGELTVVMVEVEANRANPDEDRVELRVTLPTQRPRTQKLRLIEGDTVFLGPYKIVAEEIHPAPENRPGGATVKISVELAVTPTPKGPVS